MIGTRGQISLVPSNTKEGDTICHFRDSDVAVVLRPFGAGWWYAVVGGALILRKWDEEAAKAHKASSEVFEYSAGTRRIGLVANIEEQDVLSFHLDRTTLRLLTCQPSDFEGFSDAWTTYP